MLKYNVFVIPDTYLVHYSQSGIRIILQARESSNYFKQYTFQEDRLIIQGADRVS